MALPHHSMAYRTNPEGGNDIPDLTNDRYYAQDRVRDYWAPIDQVSRALSAMTNGANVKLRGADITQGSSPTLMNVPAQFGVVRYQVTVPGSFAAAFPPTADTETIFVPVETTEQLDTSLASATLDGSTTNYVKIAYAETDGPTRTRAKISGSYVYEKIPSFTLTIDATAPTDFELSVATFTGDGVGALSITQAGTWTIDVPVTFSDDVTASNDLTVSNELTVTGQATVETLVRTDQMGPSVYTDTGVISTSPFTLPSGEYYADFQLVNPSAATEHQWELQYLDSTATWRSAITFRPTGNPGTVSVPFYFQLIRSDGNNWRLLRNTGSENIRFNRVTIS